MSPYFRFAHTVIQRILISKTNLVLEIIGRALTFVILVFLWISVSQQRGAGLGFSQGELLTYFLAMEFCRTLTDTKVFFEFQRDIQEGKIANILLLPIHSLGIYFTKQITYVGSLFVFYGISFICICLLFPYFDLPSSLSTYVLFFCSYILGALVATHLLLLLGTVAFWTTEIGNIIWGCLFTLELIGGRFAPISLFPLHLDQLLPYLPPALLYHIPGLILTEKLTSHELFLLGSVHIFWLIVLHIALQILWRKGVSKLEVVGS